MDRFDNATDINRNATTDNGRGIIKYNQSAYNIRVESSAHSGSASRRGIMDVGSLIENPVIENTQLYVPPHRYGGPPTSLEPVEMREANPNTLGEIRANLLERGEYDSCNKSKQYVKSENQRESLDEKDIISEIVSKSSEKGAHGRRRGRGKRRSVNSGERKRSAGYYDD